MEASPIIDGDPPVWPGSIVLANPADADRIVGELKAQGYDFLKPYSKLSREAYLALVAAGKQHGMALGGHVPASVGLRQALAARQRTIEHLDGWLPALAPAGEELPADSASPAYRAMVPRLDLLLVDVDPLAAPLPLVPAGVVLRGRWLPRAELEQQLAGCGHPG